MLTVADSLASLKHFSQRFVLNAGEATALCNAFGRVGILLPTQLTLERQRQGLRSNSETCWSLTAWLLSLPGFAGVDHRQAETLSLTAISVGYQGGVVPNMVDVPHEVGSQ